MKAIVLNQFTWRKAVLILLAVLLSFSLGFAQTRFYLNTTASSFTPAINAGWNVPGTYSRLTMSTFKETVSTLTTKVSGNTVAVGNKCLVDQWISEPLAAQTITGSFTGQIQYRLSNVTGTPVGVAYLYMRVLNSSGVVVSEIGTGTSASFNTTTLSNRNLTFSVPALNVPITAGQMIAIEVGWSQSSGTTGKNASISKGSSSAAADISGADNTVTGGPTLNSWFQFSNTLQFLPPANDECVGAVSLTPGVSCVNTAGTLHRATANGATPLGCFAAGTYYDVWYKFVATSSVHTVSLSSLGTNITSPQIQIYSGACGSLTSVGCASGSTLTQTGLTTGATYYVRVANATTDPSGLLTTPNFNICVTTQTPPANDLCSAATTLTSGISCVSTTGNIQYAGSQGPAGACGGATLSTTHEVWFTFVAAATSQTITLSNLGANLSAATTYIETLSGTCGSLTSLGCQAATARQTISGLTVGTTYYTRVYVTTPPVNATTANWNFDICLQQPPANDDCAGAVSLTPGASCVNTAGTLDLATANGATPLGCFAAGSYYDVWYKFVAASTVQNITLSSLGANIGAPQIQIYSGTCGSLVSVACASGTTLTQTGLTIGTTYYVRVANFNTNPSGAGLANFNICVTSLTAPINDLCANATTLTSGTACSSITSNIQYAGSQGPAGACGSATATTTYEVWFKFVAAATTQTITLSNLGANLTAAGTYIETLSGTCGSLTSLGCQAATTRQTISGLTVGTTYYTRVYVTAQPVNATTANWNFDICVQQPPANDDCAGAVTLTPGVSCVNTAGTLDLATANGATPLGCFAAGTYYDVWYKFVAGTTAQTITLSSLGANITSPQIQIYSGTCGSLVSVACASGTTLTQTGLTAGATYYVRVANFNANPSGAGLANFNICVTSLTPPVNDLCANATTLTSGVSCVTTTGNIQYAGSEGPSGACGSATLTTTYDVWYKFVATATTHKITLSGLGANLSAATTYIETLSGTCGSLTSLGCQAASTAQTISGLTIGNTYYVRVYVTAAPINATTANWNFSICIQGAPVNDNCTGAITLIPVSGLVCGTPTAGTLNTATANALTPLGCFAAGTYYDVWYKFIATSNTHYINLSGLGANFTAPRIQVYSGSCAGLVSLSCASGTSLTQTGLTPGNTYYVRVANFNVDPSGAGTVADFSICITSKFPPVNDACGAAVLLASGINCNSITSNLQFATSSSPAGACGGATLTTTYDIWYKFIATSSTQTITLSNLGANLTAASTYIESFSGVCGSLTSLGCQAASTRQTLTGLTAGNVYYTRVYVTADPLNLTTAAWNFDICVQSQPVNDDCTGAVTLTPGTACVNTAGTLDLATANGTTPLGCFAAGTYYDVWYKFVAVSASETITLSSLGANFTAARIQVYSGTCGALTSLSCASASTLTQTGLTVGNTYYVRIANFNVNPSGLGTVATFNICITYPPGPANDHCSGAVTLTPGTSCVNTAGTFINANPTAGLASCGNSNSADVWYKFIATTNFPTITLSSVGANLATASPLIQLFSGSCGALVPISTPCAASAYTPGGLGLSINSTYYVRITTVNNPVTPTSGTWTFNICITANNTTTSAIVDYGKSYVNITAGTTGGTIRPGDELEIRATLVVSKSTTATVAAIDSVAYYDTITANKGYYLMRDSMALRTNEGKLFRPSSTTFFTDTKDADAAWVTRVGADTTLQINMGTGATGFARGKIRNTSKPSNFGSTCIIMATYHVRVNAAYDTKIMYGGGAFKYRDTLTGTFYTISFPRDSLIVYSSASACPDAISPVNIVGDEVAGTFGAPSGAPVYLQNRGSSANTNYAYAAFGANAPQDYYYSVANNTSATAATNQTVVKGTSPTRVFGVWDITGDHTGATNPIKGNLPCDINQPISATNPCGYMLVVNSAYRADKAFTYTFTGACTETYYEISAWMKNICSRCGCDSNGVGSGSAGYIPTGPLDSAGIRPNVAFQIDGVDYYTTGDILHKGIGAGTTQTGSDTLNQWIKKSFVFKTAPGQTNFTMTFRNNAPGGGGNDWVIDDISMRTCFPNMTYSPSSSPSVCTGQTITLSDTVRSYYNVYIYYKWQRSTNGGITWADIAGTNGVASPTLVGPNNYQFINAYTVPPSATGMANNGDLYRMVVATNASNLAGTCNYSDVAPVTLTVLNTCIDIDDDNDGIPDYVEFNNPVALQDANSNGIPNWNDPTYAGYIDNNTDGVNDNFDFGADANNDGIPNYLDITFPGFVDSNSDGVNDNADKDLDGIINQYDLDSDNDGIPDVVESYGVDTNGDGVIDNYSDTDNDGFSNNVDGSNGGVAGSSVGLGSQDFDGDGVPNFLDTDSDSDGIPDVVEAGGLYTTNSGRLSNFVDLDRNGLSDNNTGVTGLLKSGADISPVDGRADDYPNKNLDRDFRPSAYDLDSDGDGITDVIEAGLPDADLNGKADGVNGTNGWSTTVSALPALTVRNTDGVGNPDFLDIDSDDDGIPDNIEGMSTASYLRPTSTTDTDGDGLINHYDNSPSFGGSGIFVYDHDSDGIPDYRDLDTDSDGQADIIEGNDFNLNGLPDDLVTLTGLDTDGDGLDNRFDSLNSVTNIKGTSYRMGTGGSFTGDAAPGTRATVQKTLPAQTDRDWRYISTVLPVQFLGFAGLPQDNMVLLNWSIITPQDIDRFEIERSTDNSNYLKTGSVNDPVKLNEQQSLSYTDDISGISNDIIYYRLKVIAKTGETKYSNVLVVRRVQNKTQVNIMPNPASNYVNINLQANKNSQGTVTIIDKLGRRILTQEVKIVKGTNNIYLPLEKYGQGVYSIVIETATEKINKQLIIVR